MTTHGQPAITLPGGFRVIVTDDCPPDTVLAVPVADLGEHDPVTWQAHHAYRITS
jgi:hypothetical protein